MSTKPHTVSTIPRLSSKDLSQTLLQHATSSNQAQNLDAKVAPGHIAIIDVRDDDHIGGHILHSTHVPSSQLDHKIPSLVRELKDKDIVVFHCALSQVRGPKAALAYLRARDRLLPGYHGSNTAVGEAMRVNKGDEVETEEGKGKGEDGEWEDVREKGEEKKEQKVYILERGFVGWQEEFGEDVRLTEGYRKEIWSEGYWM